MYMPETPGYVPPEAQTKQPEELSQQENIPTARWSKEGLIERVDRENLITSMGEMVRIIKEMSFEQWKQVAPEVQGRPMTAEEYLTLMQDGLDRLKQMGDENLGTRSSIKIE